MIVNLTLRRLRAMEHCLSVPLAGVVGEGDFEGLNEQDTICALAWVQQEIEKRETPTNDR